MVQSLSKVGMNRGRITQIRECEVGEGMDCGVTFVHCSISFSSLTYSELPEAKNKITTSFDSDLNYFFADLRWVNYTVYTHGSNFFFTQ